MIQEAVGARAVEFFEQERAAFFEKKTGTSRESLWGQPDARWRSKARARIRA